MLLAFFTLLSAAILCSHCSASVAVADSLCHGFKNISTRSSGEIFSHQKSGMLVYAANLDCYWQINAPPGLRLSVWFTVLDLETGFDEVIVRDGLNYSSIIGIVSGTAPVNMTSSSNVITVHFHSDGNVNKNGFRMLYQVTYAFPKFAYCGGFRNLSSTDSHEIASHSGAGTSFYRGDMHCEWLITAPGGTRLMAWFSVLDLRANGDGLVLADGLNEKTVANISGGGSHHAIYNMFITESNVLRVTFTTGRSASGTGFRLRYRSANQTASSACGALTFSNASNTTGRIVSHTAFNSFIPYWPDMYCTWSLPERIGSDYKTELSIKISNLSLALGDCLQLSSETDFTENRAVRRYCNQTSVSNVSLLVPGNVQVQFFSDGSFQSFGFSIEFQYQFYSYQFSNLTGQGDGEIVSHSGFGSREYPSNVRHTWIINAPVGNRIVAWLVSCSLDPSDLVILHDGVTGSRLDSISNCNSSLETYSTRSSVLRIDFNTDDSGTALGFQLKFNTTQPYKYCFGSMSLTEQSGVIRSHDAAGVSNYENNLDCYWRIEAAPEERILAWFPYIDLEACCDRVIFLDGTNLNSVITKISENSSAGFVSPVVASHSGAMLVRFMSDNSISGLGFILAYSRTSNASAGGQCGSINRTDSSNSSATLTSHYAYDGFTLYSSSMHCSWNFTALPGHETELHINRLSLGSGDCLRVLSVDLVAEFCGWTALDSRSAPLLAGQAVRFEFVSDENGYESTGFSVRLVSVMVDRQFHRINITNKSSGELTSHVGAGLLPYASNIRYTWQLSAPSGFSIMTWLAYCNFSSLPDSVSLYDGLTSARIHQFTNGDLSSNNFSSSSNVLLVKFVSDSSGSGLGFHLNFVITPGYEFCYGSLHLTAESGSLSSHRRAGASTYRDGMNCSWTIQAPVGESVIAWFTYVDLETCCDIVTLLDGTNSSAVIATIRETASAFDYIRRYQSTSRVMTVRFRSDSSVTARGFRLQYKSTENYCRGSRIVTAANGTICSHAAVGVSRYLNNMRCQWQITSRHRSLIRARFTYLSLNSSSDSVAVYNNGAIGSSKQLAAMRTTQISRSLTPSNQLEYSVSSFDTMRVEFSTDGEGTAFGFCMEHTMYLLDSNPDLAFSHARPSKGGIKNWQLLVTIIINWTAVMNSWISFN